MSKQYDKTDNFLLKFFLQPVQQIQNIEDRQSEAPQLIY